MHESLYTMHGSLHSMQLSLCSMHEFLMCSDHCILIKHPCLICNIWSIPSQDTYTLIPKECHKEPLGISVQIPSIRTPRMPSKTPQISHPLKESKTPIKSLKSPLRSSQSPKRTSKTKTIMDIINALCTSPWKSSSFLIS